MIAMMVSREVVRVTRSLNGYRPQYEKQSSQAISISEKKFFGIVVKLWDTTPAITQSSPHSRLFRPVAHLDYVCGRYSLRS